MPNEKGHAFEVEFANWMRNDLGFADTELNTRVSGKVADRGYEVDIHGVWIDKRWDFLWKLGLAAIALSLFAFLFPTELGCVRRAAESAVAEVAPSLAGSALLLLGSVGLSVGLIAKKRTAVAAWVECKNQKSPVKRKQMQKLLSEVADVRASVEAKWRPGRVIFASTSGFDHDALAFAREYNVECYNKVDGTFQRIQ